jgi:hypothetical protein
MKLEHVNLILLLTVAVVLGAFTNSYASDNVEWNIFKTLQLDATPVDVSVSSDGRWIFVLTDQGEVLIYSSSKKMEGKIHVGQHVDQIKSGPRGDTLIITSSQNKTVQVVSLDFFQNVNVSGAPFKGAEDAAVVIAVFDDFE